MWFSRSPETLIEGLEDGISARGTESRHVDGASNPDATSVDRALASKSSAISVEGSQSR